METFKEIIKQMELTDTEMSVLREMIIEESNKRYWSEHASQHPRPQ